MPPTEAASCSDERAFFQAETLTDVCDQSRREKTTNEAEGQTENDLL